jgi:antagonist of KipI
VTPPAVRRHLLGGRFRVTPAANRVGVVLEPTAEAPAWKAAAMVSEGTLAGSVQWTPAGRPVLLLADRGSIGGYPKPLQVIAVDTWAAGQLRPGDEIRFARSSRGEALAALAALRARLGLDDPGAPDVGSRRASSRTGKE